MAEKNELDTSSAARGVWLVKMPKFVAEKWSQAEGKGEVGKLRISKRSGPSGKKDVAFILSEDLAQEKGEVLPTPREYKFILSAPGSESLAVLSETPTSSQSEEGASSSSSSSNMSVKIEGKVVQRAECRPIRTENYMKLKKSSIEQAHKPVRSVKQLDRVVPNAYKPVKDHKSNIDYNNWKKEVGKRSRVEREQVLDMLFNAFERHQYYNIKDLVRITEQPVTYLKEILKDVGMYNMKAPHKNMWELKREYRHYKQDSEEKS